MAAKILLLIFFFFFLFMANSSLTSAQIEDADTKQGPGASQTWCVAKPSSNESDLKNNIEYVCSRINCALIQRGGPCYYPQILTSHASVVMNLFYQQNGRRNFTCYFSNSGLIVISDPSYGTCNYPYY